ncbi:MAG: XdhC family protein [Bacteriovoracaceae bacterium]|nr:XdhC family protein [Bacteriovoracaceae bacterium]
MKKFSYREEEVSHMKYYEFIEAFHERSKKVTPFAIVTLADVRGSAPQDLAARIIADENGLVFGTVGGGKVEAKCLELIKEKITKEEFLPFSVKWNLQRDVGMTCGGEVSFLFEFVESSKELQFVVYGAGHVAQALVPLLVKLKGRVVVYDTREEWINKFSKSPNLETVCTEDLPSTVHNLPENAYVILVTMGHSTDFPILKEVLHYNKFSYVGVIGSEQKNLLMKSELMKLHYTPEQIAQFHCPIGLNIGSNDPFEIAISIMAEVIQTRDKKLTL